MVVFIFLGICFTVLILWIVLTPVYVRVNTDLNQYEVSQAGTLKVSFYPWEKPAMRMRVFGVTINMVKKKKKDRPVSGVKKSKSTFKRSPSTWLYLVRGIYKSFQLKRLVCTVDLDDVVLTAQLIPIIVLMNSGVVSVNTNFMDRYFLYLEIKGRVNKLLWTFLRFFIKR